MANFTRILGMASKVIDKQMQKNGGQSGPQQQGGTDWRDIVRTAADRLTGDDRTQPSPQPQRQPEPQGQPQPRGTVDPDKLALAKYDHLLRTAPPERLEQVHHDAFARLTPGQRQQIRDRLNSELPPHEHLRDDSAGGMARAMTRGEVARPGLVRRVLGGTGRGGAFAGGAAVGAGAMALGGLGAAVAGGAVASAAAGPLLAEAANLGVDFDGIAAGIGHLGVGDLGVGDLGVGDLGDGEQLLGEGGQLLGDLGNDFLGGLFDR
ncbi:cation-transporting ATPase [Curtobacterium pusillum]|uniref:cation-transporting ATPase n=1 Tax=Curtobacterium pusillum TaxID=69373 RepID=UPI00119DF936|nr:cation-transporting ATPase [Curtobacterium pusillum]